LAIGLKDQWSQFAGMMETEISLVDGRRQLHVVTVKIILRPDWV